MPSVQGNPATAAEVQAVAAVTTGLTHARNASDLAEEDFARLQSEVIRLKEKDHSAQEAITDLQQKHEAAAKFANTVIYDSNSFQNVKVLRI